MGNQMLLVLMSVILFSTIIIGTYNSVFSQAELVYNGIILMQGQKVADSLFQRIECEILSGTSFSTVFNNLGSFTETKTLENYEYDIVVTSSLCDSLGNASSPTVDYRIVNMQISCYSGQSDTLFIGTTTNPLSKIFASNGM